MPSGIQLWYGARPRICLIVKLAGETFAIDWVLAEEDGQVLVHAYWHMYQSLKPKLKADKISIDDCLIEKVVVNEGRIEKVIAVQVVTL